MRSALRSHGRAVAAVFGFRVFGAAFIAYPLSKIVGATGVASLPQGDRALFEPGGTYLVEMLRLGGSYLAASGVAFSALFVGFAIVGLLPLAALVVALHTREPQLGPWALGTVRAIPAFVFLAGVTVLSQAILVVAGVGAAAGIRNTLLQGSSERAADLAGVGVIVATLGCVAAIGIVEDLARAEVVRSGARGVAVIGPALVTAIASPGATVLGWGARVSGLAASVLAGAWLVGRVDVGQPGTWRVAAVWGIHLVVVLAAVVLRASWMQRALGLVALRSPTPSTPRQDDTAARSDATDDPTPSRAA